MTRLLAERARLAVAAAANLLLVLLSTVTGLLTERTGLAVAAAADLLLVLLAHRDRPAH